MDDDLLEKVALALCAAGTLGGKSPCQIACDMCRKDVMPIAAHVWNAALERAAGEAFGTPDYVVIGPDGFRTGSPYDRGREDAAAAIRALKMAERER